MGRAWESPAGNLYASTLVRIGPNDPPAHSLALVTANAVHALLAPLCAGQARIKWPNDIYVGSEKVCGILIENLVSGNRLIHSIVGIGLNVNQKIFCTFRNKIIPFLIADY